MSARVKDQISLVTGAGSGLGRAIAKLLAEEGAQVVLTDINAESGANAAREFDCLFIRQEVVVVDDQPT